MYVKRLIPINWGLLESKPLDFTLSTLLVGESGMGKTIILDAIQAVFTANFEHITRFNIAKSEDGDKRAHNKEHRTLAGYALGERENTFQRTSSHTWVGTVLAPSGSEVASTFTALLGCTAVLNGEKAELTRLALYMIDGEVEPEHLTRMHEGQRIALPLEDAKLHLEGIFGSKHVEYYSEKGEYLQALYGWCEGENHISVDEAKAAARAIVKSCAFKAISNPNELIRNDVLDPVDLGDTVTQVRDIMRNIRQLTVESQRLNTLLGHLREIAADIAAARKQFRNVPTLDLSKALFQVLHSARLRTRQVKQRDDAKADLEAKEKEKAETRTSLEGIEKQLQAIVSALSQIPAAGQEISLKAQIKAAGNEIQQHGGGLCGAIAQIKAQRQDLQGILARDHVVQEPALAVAVAAAAAAADELPLPRIESLARDISTRLENTLDVKDLAHRVVDTQSRFEGLVSVLREGEGSLEGALRTLTSNLQQQYSALDLELKDKRERIGRLAEGQFDIPQPVREALALIQAVLPKAKATILAEHVEPRPNSPWIDVIEGYIGADRFAILVDEAYEVEAMNLLPDRKGARGVKPKVLQMSRLRTEGRRREMDPESILTELDIRNPIARNWLIANYGSVTKQPSVAALRHVARGLTLSGHQAGGYAVQRTDDYERAFGVAGRERALEQLRARVKTIEIELAALRNRRVFFDNLYKSISVMQPIDPRPAFTALVTAQSTLRSATEALATLDLKDTIDLRAREAKLQRERDALRGAESSLDQMIGQCSQRIKDAVTRIQAIDEGAEAREDNLRQARARLIDFIDTDSSVNPTEIEAEAHAWAETSATEAALNNREAGIVGRVDDAFRQVRNALHDYNRIARASEAVKHEVITTSETASPLESYENLLAAAKMVADQTREQEQNVLAEIADRIEDASEGFNSVFTSQFAHAMCNAIDEGVRTLQRLNTMISAHEFGGTRYRITWNMLPEMEPYADFFRVASERSDEIIRGRTIFDIELSPELTRVGAELRAMLLSTSSSDADAERRLARLMDWRNYRTYDIEAKRTSTGSIVKLSQHAKGSGGETEAPHYVVRAAVLATALRHRSAASTHLSMILLDEAFKAMDGSRSRKVMELLTQTFGFQVICSMPTKASGAVVSLFDRAYTCAMVELTGGPNRCMTLTSRVDLDREAISARQAEEHEEVEASVREEAARKAAIEASAAKSVADAGASALA